MSLNRFQEMLIGAVPNIQPMAIADIVKFYKVKYELPNGEVETMEYFGGYEARRDFEALANAVPKVYRSIVLLNREGTELERR